MPEKTKIFISSVAQGELTQLRKDTFHLLKNMGHDPQAFEENFYPWRQDNVQHCLNKVDSCQVFILYVYNKAGSFYEPEDRTVTHLEFLKAYQTKKEMIIFVEKGIIATYFSQIDHPLSEMIRSYKQQNQGKQPTYKEIEGFIKSIPNLPEEVEPYVWFFVYDIKQKAWMEKMIFSQQNQSFNTEEIMGRIKDYLSDMLYHAIQLLPMVEHVRINEELAVQFDEYRDFITDVLPLFQGVEIIDWRYFLTILRQKMQGGELPSGLGSLNNCHAITLYKREGSIMAKVAKDGAAGGNDFYELDDPLSFVSTAYISSNPSSIFYKEQKRSLYLTRKIGEYVFCFHFKLRGHWSQKLVDNYYQELVRVIMEKDVEYLKFVELIVGGVKL